MTSPFDAAALHDRINELAALGPNWDSYGAPPLDASAIQRAHDLVDALEPFAAELRAPSVYPRFGGGVEFELDGDGSKTISIGAWPDGDDWAPFNMLESLSSPGVGSATQGRALHFVAGAFLAFCRAAFGGRP